MDVADLVFKLIYGVIITICLYTMGISLISSIILSHSINWILNGQFPVLARYLGDRFYKKWTLHEANDFVHWLSSFNNHWIEDILIYGSYCRGEFSERSDLDVRILVSTGLLNSVKGALLVVFIKHYSFLRYIPVDIYSSSRKTFLNKMANNETPISLRMLREQPTATVPHRVCLSGPDGVGKSSVISGLTESMKAAHKWRRRKDFLVRPFNLVMKWMGKNTSIEIGGTVHGFHNYSGFYGVFYAYLSWLDYYLVGRLWYAATYERIFDRCLIDWVVDTMISVDDEQKVLSIFDNSLRGYLKKNLVIVLTADRDILLNRRSNLKFDYSLERKLNYYRFLVDKYNILHLDSTRLDKDESLKWIENSINL